MLSKFKFVTIIAALVCGLDQLTKNLVIRHLEIGQKIVIWENFFDLVHVHNRGAAFGFLSGWNSSYREIFFYVLFVVAIFFLLNFLKSVSEKSRFATFSIGLVLGGAIGNLIDRLSRGSVVDFLSFHWYDKRVQWNIFDHPLNFELTWPAFNVADSAITVGVVWLMVMMMGGERKNVSLSG